MSGLGTENLEKLRGTHLERDDQVELLTTQTECSFVFLDDRGWPRGVVMSFIYEDGRFWLTAVEGRAHVRAADRDERVSIVVSAAGSGLPGRRMVSVRGRVTVHRDRETIDWFLGEFTQRLQPEDPHAWRTLLDSPNRVVFEVEPVAKPVSHDQRKIPGNGRGMAAEPDRHRKRDSQMSTDPALLAARSARVYYTYARAVDEGDLDTLRDLVTDDIQVTRGDHPTEDGVEAFLDVYRAHIAQGIPVCKHVVTNIVAERVGDEVVTHAYFQATMLEEERTRVVIGVYDDVHREAGGALKLAHKKIRVQRTLELPASSGNYGFVGR